MACALTTTGLEADIENGPIYPQKAEEYLFGDAGDREGISYGGSGHDPYGGWKGDNPLRWEYICTVPNMNIHEFRRYVHCSRRPISGWRTGINGRQASADCPTSSFSEQPRPGSFLAWREAASSRMFPCTRPPFRRPSLSSWCTSLFLIKRVPKVKTYPTDLLARRELLAA